MFLPMSRFRSGDISTKFLEEEYPKGYSGGALTAHQKGELVPSVAVLHHLKTNRTPSDVSLTDGISVSIENYF